MAPTLNPDPEALLDFACRALGQAGIQPSVVHLEREQGDQLLLAPHVHLSGHPHLPASLSLPEILPLALEVQLPESPSHLSYLVFLPALALALPGSP